MLQVGKPSSAIRLPFDQFEAVNVSFHWPGTVGLRQSRQNRWFVPLNTVGKGVELSDGGSTHVLEPGVSSVTAAVTDEIQEAMRQLPCLRKLTIHLRDPIQLYLGLWVKLPWTGQHPADDLSRGQKRGTASDDAGTFSFGG